jgi:hypothetical protein
MDSSEMLDREIEELEAQLEQIASLLKRKKAARAVLKKGEVEELADSPSTRFYKKKHKASIREILEERGKPMKKSELRKILLDGGAAEGNETPESDIDLSIKINARNNNITRSGKDKKAKIEDDELIGLPEWPKTK